LEEEEEVVYLNSKVEVIAKKPDLQEEVEDISTPDLEEEEEVVSLNSKVEVIAKKPDL